jgi:menaquinol-cytochrome c reductase cytochrome b/c subunit
MTESGSDEVVFPKDGTKTYHLVEVVRGQSTMIDKGPENTVFAFPIVAIIELVLALGVTAVLVFFSLVKNAPLEAIANPLVTADPAKAPWYFIGLQELLVHAHPLIAGVILPTLMVIFVAIIPYLDTSREGSGRWFTSERGKKLTWMTALYTLLVMPAYIILDDKFPLREIFRGVVPDVITQIVLPLMILAMIVTLPLVLFARWKLSARECLLILFTELFFAAIIFTVTGFFFRGPGFKLYWPWGMPNGYNPLDGL